MLPLLFFGSGKRGMFLPRLPNQNRISPDDNVISSRTFGSKGRVVEEHTECAVQRLTFKVQSQGLCPTFVKDRKH